MSTETAHPRPNVLLVLTDDQGFGDIGSHGNDLLDTPELDRLAEQGARFDRFFVSPLCAPTRASLLTGRYHPRTGVLSVTGGTETLSAEETTLSKAFKAAGYATGCFGKWHNGKFYPHDPKGNAFDEFLGFTGGHFSNFFDPVLLTNDEPVQTKGFITDVFTDAALDFISRNRRNPFFCYVPFNAPHSPLQCPDDLFEKYRARGLEVGNACLYAECENIDWNVGRILRALDEWGLSDNTIVIFLTDNGPSYAVGTRYNAYMKGQKGNVDEGGNRVPMFMRWPGRVRAGSIIEQIAAHIDVFPTLAEWCGLPAVGSLPVDGVSLVPLLEESADTWPDRMLFTHVLRANPEDRVDLKPGAVRTPRYRLVVSGERDQLFDMVADPCQKTDLAEQLPDVARQLRAAYDSWFDDVAPEGKRIHRLPLAVGYEQSRRVELPSQWASFHGNAKFHGRGWEEDWATGIVSARDGISWNIDVVADATFEVSLRYTIPAENVGVRVRVDTGNQSLEATIHEAHDPPEIQRPDRVPRWEVNEKDWAELVIGSITLSKGPATIHIHPVDVPGPAAMDVRALVLRREN